MKRYQVVTHSYDIGTDEHMDFSKFGDAARSASKFKGLEEYCAIYDRIKQIAYVVFGDISTPVFCDFVKVVEH